MSWAGTLWHAVEIALAGRLRHPDATVHIDEVQRALELHYHSLGGWLTRRVVADTGERARGSIKPSFAEKVHDLAMHDLLAWLDQEQVHLPKAMDRYATRSHNRELYFWLAAYLAEEQPLCEEPALPLGVRHLLRGVATSARISEKFPALGERYQRLCAAELAQRKMVLPRWDAAAMQPVLVLEAAIRYALGAAQPPRDEWLSGALESARTGRSLPPAPRRSPMPLPFLPVTLWGHPSGVTPGLRLLQFKRQKRRTQRGLHKRLARPHFDPSRRPEPADGIAAEGAFLYPEWADNRRAYRADWCSVHEQLPEGEGRASFEHDAVALARRVRRQFEALRQQTGWNRHLDNGDEVDLDAYVESVGDARGCGYRSSRIYRQRVRRWRDLSAAVLLDASRSTEAWVGKQRVIGIARDSMYVLAEALAAGADDFGLFAFASDSRLRVYCYRVKDFDEAYDESTRQRMLALKPGHYTRMGAAIRHMGSRLVLRPREQKLLLVLTDGRPHDPADGYEGNYALEDTRRALLELRARGVHCFGLTIDRHGAEYLPHLFGAGRYAVFADAKSLPEVLPGLYARITA